MATSHPMRVSVPSWARWYYLPLATAVILAVGMACLGWFAYAAQKTRYLDHVVQLSQQIVDSYRNKIVAGEMRDLVVRVGRFHDVMAIDVLDRQCRSMVRDRLVVSNCDDRAGTVIDDGAYYRITQPVYFDGTQRDIAAYVDLAFYGRPLVTARRALYAVLAILVVALGCSLLSVYLVFARGMRKLAVLTIDVMRTASAISDAECQQALKWYPPPLRHVIRESFARAHRLHRAEQELQDARVATTLGHLAAQVAHDLCGPLSSMQVAMRGFELQASADAKTGKYLQLLQMSAKRVGDIADDLLQRHQGASDRPVIFSIHAVIDELIGEYQGRGDLQHLLFVKRYHHRALELYGERGRLQRAIGNIIKNAIEAMHGMGQILISTGEEAEHIVIAVADTGPGMSPEILSRVLQGGFTAGKRDGHGIGMQVVREAAAALGGCLEGESVVGVGTTFQLILAKPTDTQREAAEHEVMALKELIVPVIATDPVIVVDDEPSMREQWRILLAEHHRAVRLYTCYEDMVAQDVSEAVSRTAIVDYHFANSIYTGLDVVRWLRSRGVVHVILCTAEYWKPSLQRAVQELGMVLCPKPVPARVVVRSDVESFEPVLSEQAASSSVRVPPVACPSDPDVSASRDYHVLVLDDDEDIRLSWELVQEDLGIAELATFASMEDCEQAQPDYTVYDFAFVDKNIPTSAWRLDQVIAHLKQAGVRQVYIASGEGAEALAQDAICQAADGIVKWKIPDKLPVQ